EAYASVVPAEPETAVEDILRRPIAEWKELLVNDFEKSVFPKHPRIAAIKEEMYAKGAVYAAMSGSGSAVYGIFRNL
ncbi:MAG: 4-(cytidine 5'-diphospho)-2-C-methyl-D-erythritol kinase, partial [Bacteroidales bacterium]|nr:4-(cytidine 5'-diphospho)-2-C-methyl-D-erythritol kinase [Bacteroidales bacterium]